MSITSVEYDRYRLIKVIGFLDGHTSESCELKDLLSAAAPQIDSNTVIDLSAVEYVNSSMLGLFVRFLSDSQTAGFQVALLNPPPSVRNVLDMTGLSHVLPVVDKEDELAAALGQEPEYRVAEANVDFDHLTEEIENIIVKGSAPDPDDSELGRLLGKD